MPAALPTQLLQQRITLRQQRRRVCVVRILCQLDFDFGQARDGVGETGVERGTLPIGPQRHGEVVVDFARVDQRLLDKWPTQIGDRSRVSRDVNAEIGEQVEHADARA